MEIEKLKNEIKSKDEEILLNKLNNEKVNALNIQKINFLEKELGQWKERYNIQSKDFSEAKSQLINLTAENDKLNGEIQSLKNKFLKGNMRINTGDNTNDENIYLKTDNNTNLSNLNLNNILKGHDEIRDYIQQLKDIISILIKNNTELNYSNQNLALSISNIEDNNISLNKQNDENEKNDNIFRLYM